MKDRWSAYPAFAAGHALYSPRAIRHLRVLKWVTGAISVFCALGALAGPVFIERKPLTLPLLAIGVGGGLFSIPFLFVFFALYLLLFAHVMRVMGLGVGWLSQLLPFGELRLSIVAAATRFFYRPLLPQLELREPGELLEGRARGVLAETLTLDFVRDSWGFFERFDVLAVSPAQVKLDSGELTTVALEHGGIEYGQAMSKRLEGGGQLPAWLDAPGRAGVQFRREFPAGTRVIFSRGRAEHDEARVSLTLT